MLKAKDDKGQNVMDTIGYWREYPERDLEHVRRYPCTIEPLDEEDVWLKKSMGFYCYLPVVDELRSAQVQVNEYFEAVLREMELYAAQPYVAGQEVTIGFIDGGLFSQLAISQIDKLFATLLQNFNAKEGVAFALKVDGGGVDEAKANLLRDRGVKRAMVFASAFDDALLKKAGGPFGCAEVEKALTLLKNSGIEEVGIDITYGMPGQTVDQLSAALKKACSLPVQLISLGAFDPQNDKAKPMYNRAVEQLLAAGYKAVTANIFAATDLKMSFPEHIWYKGIDLVAVGLGTGGCLKEHLYRNHTNLKKYLAALQKGELPVVKGKRVTAKDKIERALAYGLKLLQIKKGEFESVYGISVEKAFKEKIKNLEKRGLAKLDSSGLALAYPKGWENLDEMFEVVFA